MTTAIRRLAFAAGLVWAIAVIAFYSTPPYVALQFADAPQSRIGPALTESRCHIRSGIDFEYVTRDIGGGRIIGVGLCFHEDRAHWPDREPPLPSALLARALRQADAFELPDEARQLASDQWQQKRAQQIKTASLTVAAGWLPLIAVTALAGVAVQRRPHRKT